MTTELLFIVLNVLFLAPALILAMIALALSGYRASTSLWDHFHHPVTSC